MVSFLKSTLLEGMNQSVSILRTAVTKIESSGDKNKYLAAVLVIIAAEILGQSESEETLKLASYLRSTARRLMT